MATSLDNFNDLEELGINCSADDSLSETFNQAANHLASLVQSLDNQTLLDLYGYYKQGHIGPCNVPKPSWYDMKAKSKWEAWNKLGNLPQDEAKTIYIDRIRKLDPNFLTSSSAKESWVSVSTLQNNDFINNVLNNRNIIDYVKEGNVDKVRELLSDLKNNIDDLDTDGLGLIHWASDRGSTAIVKILIDTGANINLKDSDGQTALHYASSCAHFDCVKLLLEHSADKNLLDNDGCSAESVASDDSVKELLTNCN